MTESFEPKSFSSSSSINAMADIISSSTSINAVQCKFDAGTINKNKANSLRNKEISSVIRQYVVQLKLC